MTLCSFGFCSFVHISLFSPFVLVVVAKTVAVVAVVVAVVVRLMFGPVRLIINFIHHTPDIEKNPYCSGCLLLALIFINLFRKTDLMFTFFLTLKLKNDVQACDDNTFCFTRNYCR